MWARVVGWRANVIGEGLVRDSLKNIVDLIFIDGGLLRIEAEVEWAVIRNDSGGH
jgi:hypothetical protein